jgi:hypothetical protein
MPDSVQFDGVDDKIDIGGFPANTASGAMTLLAILRLTAYDAYDTVFGWNSEDAGLQFDAFTPIAGQYAGYSPGFVSSLDTTGYDINNDVNDWLLLGWGKAAGTVVPRYHKYSWATSVWGHSGSNGNATITNMPALTALHASNNIVFGTQQIKGQLLIAGVWNSLLTDTQVEALIAGKQAWIDAAPVAAWRFDSATVLNTIVGATTQTSRTGTTLAAGVAPAGWLDSAAPPVTLQQIRPDADVTTTGWTTAPLYSKVDEAVADDGDFITSTAS